jgi:mycothiol synthase
MNPTRSSRPASLADAEAIAALLNECTASYHPLGARTSVAEAEARLHQGGSDPSTDSRLALMDGRVVGFAHVWAFTPDEMRAFARVAPDARGQGLGSSLLRFCEDRAAEIARDTGARFMTLTHWAGDEAAQALLKGRGYVPIRYFLSMAIDLRADRTPDVALPRGVDVRGVDLARDRAPLHAAYTDAFADHWGFVPQSADDWWTEHLDGELDGFDPGLWLVASAGGEAIGFSLCRIVESEGSRRGRVGLLGVRRSWRGRGLGLALLRRSFDAFRARGLEGAVLDVDADNVTAAIRLYTKAGMSARPTFTVWRRDLAPPPG